MPPILSRLKPAIIAVCVLLVAGAIVLLVRHRATPPAKLTAHPAATPTPAMPSPTATVVLVTPSPTVTASSPTVRPPTPTRPASPTASPAPQGPLVDGPYGFPVPRGWTFSALAPGASGAQAAHWNDPASPARIDYLVVTTPGIYSVDHTVNLGAIEGALPCQKLPPTTFTYVPGKGPRYTCAPQGALNVNGAVMVKPYPQGFRLLQIQLPPAQDPLAVQIIAGFH